MAPSRGLTPDVEPHTLTKKRRVSEPELPIHAHKQSILDAVKKHRVVVLIGETGSGKTTQVPQFLHAEGHSRRGTIAVTQPRRVAAVSVATRVATEMACEVGDLVGYRVRFLNRTSPQTCIKFMTDGMFVLESVGPHGFGSCSVVILDEAHERSVHTDVLLGLVRRALDDPKYANLRVLVMSATVNPKIFVDFFGGPEVVGLLRIPGRLHPIALYYTPTPELDFLEAALISVLQIHIFKPPGDVLVFLPGQEDIDSLQHLLAEKCELINARRRDAPEEPVLSGTKSLAEMSTSPRASSVDNMLVRPIYSALPFDQQQLVFQPTPEGCRKVVVATNIAETSITIPGIRYVVDTGLMKMKVCHPQTGIEILRMVETSKASADQRAGRAGREAPGEAYRLYVEEEYAKMPPQTPAEILRVELATVYLELRALGIDSVGSLPLVDPLPKEALIKAAHLLRSLGALDGDNKLTDVGRRLSMVPLPPQLGYFLYVSVEFECVAEALTIVSMLATDAPFFYYQKKLGGKALSAPLHHEDGDHLTLLSIFSQWSKSRDKREFVTQHALNATALETASSIRKQLKEGLRNRWALEQIPSCGGPKNWTTVRRCLLKANFMQIARLDEGNQTMYMTLSTRQQARLHPTCGLFRKRSKPAFVVFNEITTTSRNYLRTATEVDGSWLVELCPQFFAARA